MKQRNILSTLILASFGLTSCATEVGNPAVASEELARIEQGPLPKVGLAAPDSTQVSVVGHQLMFCGDDQRVPGEACEGDDLDGQSCASLGAGSGTLSCSSTCNFDTSACAEPEICDDTLDNDGDGAGDCADSDCADTDICAVCGDGNLTGSETCEGGVADLSCVDLGYSAGDLSCADCQLDASACYGSCGDGVVQGAEQCDGDDFNGLSCASLGYGGGAMTCQSCAVDSSACYYLGTCEDPAEIQVGSYIGTTVGQPNSGSASGACDDLGTDTADKVYRFRSPSSGTVTFTLTSVSNLGLHVRNQCGQGDISVECSALTDGTGSVSAPVNAGEYLFVYVDGYGVEGDFVLQASVN